MTPPPRLLALIAVIFLLQGAMCAAALAEGGSADSGPGHQKSGTIGMRLLEASSNRRDDPRALIYIVDHINPGTKISRRLEVSNTSGSAQRVTMFPGAADIDQNKFVPASNRHANELSSWISLDRPVLTVPANSSAEVKATITVPKTASKGERYGAVWAEVASSLKPGSEGDVAMINRVGVRVYLDVGPGGDPPSDFRVEQLTPGRTQDGVPVVNALVKNTGQRALDMEGWLWLSDGPSGMKAGPFPAQLGTTLAPGAGAPVVVLLDDRLIDGPWRVKLMLQSGLVRRIVTGTLTFPRKNATWGRAALLDSLSQWVFVAVGVLAAGVAMAIARFFLRRRLTERANPAATPRT